MLRKIRLRADHAVAGLRRAAGLGDDDDEGLGQRKLLEHTQHAVGVRVVQKAHGQAFSGQRICDQLRAQGGTADADDQAGAVGTPGGGHDTPAQNIRRKSLQRRKRLVNLSLQLRRRGQRAVAQPVMPHHAALIRVGDRPALQLGHLFVSSLCQRLQQRLFLRCQRQF